MSCSAILVSGPNKGTQCPAKAKADGRCGRHAEASARTSSPTSALPEETPYSGETVCQGVFASGKKKGVACDRPGYYYEDNQIRCGVHSDKETRIKLRKKPVDTQSKQQEIEDCRATNVKEGYCGSVKLFRMGMMKPVDCTPGYLNVFPNYRHGNRTDGLGLATLSPMKLGPVAHGQPGLPEAKTIEGFHQYSKCFSQEACAGEPGPLFYENRLKGYETTEPSRRKYTGAPLYFVWVGTDGKEQYLDYITSRQFYCSFYERLACTNKEFLQLKELHESGTNIQICGYDAYPVEDVETDYLNPKVPFGHERVLYTMLLVSEDEYPWRKHKTFEF